MKKFQFTLSRTLDYREQILTEEKNTLASLQGRQNVIEQKICFLEGEFQRISQEMAQEQLAGIPVFRLIAYDGQRTNIRRQLEQLHIDLAEAEKEVSQQIDVVVEASQEVSKLDKLREKQLEEYNKAIAAAEELVIEEFVSAQMARQEEM